VLLEKRHRSDSTTFDCLITTSTIDFPILDPRKKNSKKELSPYYSHHVKGPALRYEVGVSIFGGDIVWTNGPFRAGCETESEIFENLKESIDPDEIAEQFSRLDLFCDKSPDSDTAKMVPSKTRDRQKMVNDRLMSFKILQRFRHNVLSHDTVFRAIVALVQLSIEKEIVTFELDLETHNQLQDQQQQLMKSEK
jgi:hypothetical protein